MKPATLLLAIALNLIALTHAQDVATAASSPDELSRFVDTHTNFAWEPLWRALNLTEQGIFLPPCEASNRGVPSCSVEIITVVNPPQAIVILEHRSSMFQVFLRYQSIVPGAWKFAGAFAPGVKYFPPEHRVTRFGTKPFLVVSGQGVSGTGVSSKLESWLDLTAEGFAPALRFTSEGHDSPRPEGIGRVTKARVLSMVSKPVERITVAYSIEFEAIEVPDTTFPIGGRQDRVAYTRSKSGNFEIDEAHSTATSDQVESFYENFEETGFDSEDLLKFNFKGLSAIAKAPPAPSRAWLSRFLEQCSGTPESRQLKQLISSSH
jgi:hypothetical protein